MSPEISQRAIWSLSTKRHSVTSQPDMLRFTSHFPVFLGYALHYA